MNLRRGFTVIELTVVIVVVGVLAAIVSIGYGTWRDNIMKDTIKSDLNNAVAAMEQERTWNNAYPETLPGAFTPSDGVIVSGGRTEEKTYCLTAYSAAKPEMVFFKSNNDTTVKEGSCPWTWSTITAGGNHTCALSLGKAFCWGLNNGKLGNGGTANSLVPVEVSKAGTLAGKAITAISAGTSHTCALADGRVFCWGESMYGRLGNGSSSTSPVLSPVDISATGPLAGKKVTAIAAGGSHTCAIASARAYCWGNNEYGQLGLGHTSTNTSTFTPSPVQTSAMYGKVTAISTGDTHTCAIADAKAFCWGLNTNGQLGTGWPADNASTPVAVTATTMGTSVAAISVSNQHSCSHANYQVWCWGSQFEGRLGDGQLTGISYVPKKVIINGYTGPSLTGGAGHTCQVFTYMTPKGRVMCWGDGANGKLGSGTTGHRTEPYLISAGETPSGETTRNVSAGVSHTCAVIGADAYCWGANTQGQLGNGTTNASTVPVKVTRP